MEDLGIEPRVQQTILAQAIIVPGRDPMIGHNVRIGSQDSFFDLEHAAPPLLVEEEFTLFSPNGWRQASRTLPRHFGSNSCHAHKEFGVIICCC